MTTTAVKKFAAPSAKQVNDLMHLYVPESLPGRIECPTCKKDVALTSTGKVWMHEKPNPNPSKSLCEATGVQVRTHRLVGKELVDKAKELAYFIHRADTDKSQEAYHHHLQAVAIGTWVLAGDNPVAQAAAYLHDSIEDHSSLVSAKKLASWGFPDAVIETVLAVTKLTSEPQEDYLARIIAAGQDAMLVKLADLMHNARLDRMAKLPDYTQKRLLKKYTPAKATLMLELGMIQTPEGQELATKPVGTAVGYYATSADGSIAASPGSMLKGDWPAGWPSPVAAKGQEHEGGRLFLLEDDSTVWVTNARGALKLFTPGTYNSKAWTDKGRSPATETPKETGHLASATDVEFELASPNYVASYTPGKPIETVDTGWPEENIWDTPLAGYADAQQDDDVVLYNSKAERTLLEEDALAEAELTGNIAVERGNHVYSICGKCGALTVQTTYGTFIHAKSPDQDFHTSLRPTNDRFMQMSDWPVMDNGEETLADYIEFAVDYLLEYHAVHDDKLYYTI